MEREPLLMENISYPEIIATLQSHFDVDQETVEGVFRGIYRDDLKRAKDMKSGTWTFRPQGERAIIVKSTGRKYLIGTDTIKQFDPASKELKSRTILRVYKKWRTDE